MTTRVICGPGGPAPKVRGEERLEAGGVIEVGDLGAIAAGARRRRPVSNRMGTRWGDPDAYLAGEPRRGLALGSRRRLALGKLGVLIGDLHARLD